MSVEDGEWLPPAYMKQGSGTGVSPELLEKYDAFLSNLKGRTKMPEREPLNMVRVSIGLGKAPDCAVMELTFSDSEGKNESVMAVKRDMAVNEAQKLHALAKLVFTPEISAPKPTFQPSPAPVQAPGPAAQGASQSGNPVCAICGAMEVLKPAGVSKKTGRAYSSFWFCPNRLTDARHPQ